MKKLDIGMFHATLPSAGRKLGGVEVFVHRMANHLVTAGHDCTVYSLDAQAGPGGLYEHVGLFPRIGRFFQGKLARWILLPAALNFAPWRRHDAIVLHGDDWFLVRRSSPTYRLFHGAAFFEARSATSRKRKLMQGLIHHAERLSSKLCDRSGAVGSDTAKLMGCQDVVDCGIDPAVHHPGDRSPTPRALFVGTWEGRKQGALAWKIFVEEILPARPDAILDFVADREPPVPHPNVRYHRFPSDEALAALFRSAWLFLYPSSYEGFGIPYLEALASGTPVVCLPNEGSVRLLTGCSAAFLREDPLELGKASIEVLAKGPDAYRDEAVAWTGKFRWPAVVERYARIFQEMSRV